MSIDYIHLTSYNCLIVNIRNRKRLLLMNCTVCGRELPDNAKFCSHCGYAVLPTLEYEQMYTTGDTVYNHFEFPRKKNKFLRIPLVVSLFLLLSIGTTIIILLVSYSGVDNSSIDAVIESYFNSIADKDIDDLFDTMYPIVISAYEEQAYSKEEIYEQINLMTAYKNYNNSAIEFSDIKITYTEYEGDESLD